MGQAQLLGHQVQRERGRGQMGLALAQVGLHVLQRLHVPLAGHEEPLRARALPTDRVQQLRAQPVQAHAGFSGEVQMRRLYRVIVRKHGTRRGRRVL